MSNELNINDEAFLLECVSGTARNIRKQHDFKEPKANKRKDGKRIISFVLEEKSFQYLVDQARARNMSINACVGQLIKEEIFKS